MPGDGPLERRGHRRVVPGRGVELVRDVTDVPRSPRLYPNGSIVGLTVVVPFPVNGYTRA